MHLISNLLHNVLVVVRDVEVFNPQPAIAGSYDRAGR